METSNPVSLQSPNPTPILSFHDVAKKIIKKAIRSAVCIDDMFLEPYMTNEEIEIAEAKLKPNEDGTKAELERVIPRNLYKPKKVI